MAMYPIVRTLVLSLGLGMLTTGSAHPSYSMFDGNRTLTVTGTVAKLEWTNPHADYRSIDPDSGKQGFDLTPPADLPPPPVR